MTDSEPPGDDTGQSDLADLARQYVDLWQKQLSEAASDEAMADMMAQTVQLMNAGAASMATMAASAATSNPESKERSNDHDGGKSDSGASATSASSGADNDVIDELNRRIKQLEDRIAALESESQGQS